MTKYDARPLNRRSAAYRLAACIDAAVAPLTKTQDNILVSGFWRSGTTWLQQSIADAITAKTIFEPFSPKARPPFNAEVATSDAERARHEAYIPLSLDAFSTQDQAYLDSAIRGVCWSRFSFLCRTRITDSLRRRTVIKLVRGHFLLDDIIRQHGVRTVHIVRHPGAAVSSMLHARWDWNFDTVRFSDFTPAPGAAPERLRSQLARLQAYDTAPNLEKITAYWAFCERHVASLSTAGLIRADYDDLMLGGDAAFADLMTRIEGRFDGVADLSANSIVTAPDRKDLDNNARSSSWKKVMSDRKRERMVAVMKDMWPEALERWPDLAPQRVTRFGPMDPPSPRDGATADRTIQSEHSPRHPPAK